MFNSDRAVYECSDGACLFPAVALGDIRILFTLLSALSSGNANIGALGGSGVGARTHILQLVKGIHLSELLPLFLFLINKLLSLPRLRPLSSWSRSFNVVPPKMRHNDTLAPDPCRDGLDGKINS